MSHSLIEIFESLTSDQRRLLDLIRAYTHGVGNLVNYLQHHLCGHPLRLREEGKLPDKGEAGPLNIRFHFHAHGVVVLVGSIRLEFDFGPNNRCDGFSAYLLDRHVRLNKHLRRDRDLDIYATLPALLNLQLIHAPHWEPTPHLMYLTETGRDVIDCIRRAR